MEKENNWDYGIGEEIYYLHVEGMVGCEATELFCIMEDSRRMSGLFHLKTRTVRRGDGLRCEGLRLQASIRKLLEN